MYFHTGRDTGNWFGECDQREWETAALLQTGNKSETPKTKREQNIGAKHMEHVERQHRLQSFEAAKVDD